MTSTQTTMGAATPTTKTRKRQPSREGQPQKAGWFARIVVFILCFLWIVPVIGLFLTSFRPRDDANESGWWTLFWTPSAWSRMSFDNYETAIDQGGLGQAFVNSLAITLPATFIPILVAAFAAYAFAFMEFPGRNFLFLAVVSLLVVPNYIAFVPILRIYGDLQIAGTFPAVWLAHIGFGMSLAIYILRNYMATLPRSVIESAKIDGASHFQTFFRLVLPMSLPALAAFAIFQFLWVWNDLLVALIFVGSGDNKPLTIALVQLLGAQGQGWQLLTAGALFTMIVPIIVFLSLQRYFVRGLTAGSVKG
ncbi:MAG TPA: carbohydrate ABC transporter permease [Microlunatus sp.]|nr:carbohydrate ABC transporter permease [Microlunatus sp.]